MQSTARNRKTGEYHEIIPTAKIKLKPRKEEDAHREAAIIAENIAMLAARYRVSSEQVASHAGITSRCLRYRLASPWEFRMEELEGIARLFDVTVRQMFARMTFED